MINASEAKRKSLINSKGKKILERLEARINRAISEGMRSAAIGIDILEPSSDSYMGQEHQELRDAVVKELVELGYKVDFKFAEPLPGGCPSDQWNFDNGHIKVEW